MPDPMRRFSSKPGHRGTQNRAWYRRTPFIAVFSLITGGLIYGLNLIPDRRQLSDPKHYYTNIGIRMQTSKFATLLAPWVAASLANLTVPASLRECIYGTYVRFYDCRMDEAEEESLKAYPTFAAFFNRELKQGVRPVSHSMLVSPSDGTVLHFGKVEDGRIEFVKDNDYEVHEFLGPINVDTKEGNALFQVVIYLAPGDYHAFHSPTEWRVLEKIHFPGFLQSVRPSNLLLNPRLFTENERVVLSGQWEHGYFSMTAVAALFVGNIVILNEPVRNRKLHETEEFSVYDEKMSFTAGKKVGEFRMGSTIVLIFEAPENIGFCIGAGDKLRYGQSLVVEPRF